MRHVKDVKGFTLIELMIVVAIIGILAAIAIPNFLKFQLKSKSAEVKTNLGGIRTAEEAYKAENDVYYAAALNPAAHEDGKKVAWGTPANFETIGFSPAADVYYSYVVNIATTTLPVFTAYGHADLDTDGTRGCFSYLSSGTTASGTAPSGCTAPTKAGTIVNSATGKF